jgi:pentatricopeptide repeat protein
MMECYASRLGEVVSLTCDMVRSGRAPNLNTYWILIKACQRADQAHLAMEVYAVMRASKIPILQKVGAAPSFSPRRRTD